MITIIIQDQQGTELDRFQMIHAAFEDRSNFPDSPDLFASFVDKEQIDTLGNTPYARLIRAAYFQGRAGGGVGNEFDVSLSAIGGLATPDEAVSIVKEAMSLMELRFREDLAIQAVNEQMAPRFTVGTAVVITKDNGEEEQTYVRQTPWKTGSGAWLVSVEGIAGGYALQRVRLRAPGENGMRGNPAVQI